MNCRGDDGIDAKRSRPSIGKTRYKCHARLERAVLVGTRSADYIRASGHSGRIQRPYTWLPPTPFAEMPDFFPCTAGAVHTWHLVDLHCTIREIRAATWG